MTNRPFVNRETAREAGKRGAATRWANRLTPERIRASLPPMTSPENIRAGLEAIREWACAALLSGSLASAAVRSCEVALKALDSSATFEVIEGLRAEVRTLVEQRDAAVQDAEQLRIELARAKRTAVVV